MLFIVISATEVPYYFSWRKKYGLTRIYIRCSRDAPLKTKAYFQHILLSWITGKVLNFGYSWLEDLQLFGLLLFFKCIEI